MPPADTTTLVTGAAGFVGRHLVQHLREQGATVRASDRDDASKAFFDALGVALADACSEV